MKNVERKGKIACNEIRTIKIYEKHCEKRRYYLKRNSFHKDLYKELRVKENLHVTKFEP